MKAPRKKPAAHGLLQIKFFSLEELKAALETMTRANPVALEEAGRELCGTAGLYYDDRGAARLAIIIRRT